MIDELLHGAMARGELRAVDLYFARRMAALDGSGDPRLLLAAALASHRVGEGDVCLALDDCAELPLFQLSVRGGGISLPGPADWAEGLRGSPVVGRPGERAPLILDEARRLYLGRYWHFERELVNMLEARIGTWVRGVDRERLRAGLDRLFGPVDPAGNIDWQRVAAAMSVLRPLCVISGGPGTGKTRTVTSILALLAQQSGGTPLRLALAAPTGKAAARLTESIRGAKQALGLAPEVASLIPEDALTLHRLLGFRPGRANPRHGPGNPLHLDVLVVDEASMVDLPLMARLVGALPQQARLVLLGDKDQLASVEAGMVLGDICGRGADPGYSAGSIGALREMGCGLPPIESAAGPGIADHIVTLRKSWRFDDRSGIGALARAVNAGDADAAVTVLADGRYPDVELVAANQDRLARQIADSVVPACRDVLAAATPATALDALNEMRVLCAVRDGPYGLHAVNRKIEQALEAEGLIRRSAEIYAGRPVMVIANDHAQRLYNGDVGLIRPDPASGGALRVFFATAEGPRRVLPSRLPPHETVYAMTVHKSQGSEFTRVLLVLPDVQTRVLTRELVYTGITRAKRSVSLMSDEQRLRGAVAQRVSRSTGLFGALWEGGARSSDFCRSLDNSMDR